MPEEPITLDVFLVTVTIPPDHPNPEVITIRRTLNRASFLSRLHEAVAKLVQQFPTLSAVTVSISR